MKKRILSILLLCCMVLTLLPTTAFAEGSTEELPVCTCETACTAETMNTACSVCGADGALPESCAKANTGAIEEGAPAQALTSVDITFPAPEAGKPVGDGSAVSANADSGLTLYLFGPALWKQGEEPDKLDENAAYAEGNTYLLNFTFYTQKPITDETVLTYNGKPITRYADYQALTEALDAYDGKQDAYLGCVLFSAEGTGDPAMEDLKDLYLLSLYTFVRVPEAQIPEDTVDEQFDLAPDGTYYFDLSGVSIPGTVNDALPDKTRHYVPFTYAGTVDAYKLASAMAITEEDAEKYKYAHSLFVADYAVTHTINWNALNDASLIFGKDYAAGGVDYTLRAPSVGSGSIGSAESQRGNPQSNEWDMIMNKNEGYVKNLSNMFSWGQDNEKDNEKYAPMYRAVRGYFSARYWGSSTATGSSPLLGFRPILEVLNPGSLGPDGLKAVTLGLGGGKLGNSSEDIQIIVKKGSEFTAPASDGLTRPDGNPGSYFKWLGSDGNLYAPGDNVPAEVTKLTARFAHSGHSVTITTDTLSDGKVGVAYSQTLTADGTKPITWHVTAGELPKGLRLNRNTGEISGTPTAAGAATFTVMAANSLGSDTKVLTITIAKAQQYGKVSMDFYIYGETPSTPSLTDRTGDGSVTYYYNTTNSNSGGTKWENIQPNTLNAGTRYYMYAELGETENYDSFTTACKKFWVMKAIPTCTKPTGLTAKYGQKLSQIALPNPEGNTPGTWRWQEPETVLDQLGTRSFYADFKPDNENYSEVVNVAIDVTVGPADGRSLKTVELTQRYTDTSEHTYTPDWSGLPAGQTWRYNSEYSVSTGSHVTLTKHDFAADGSLLTYAISGGKAGDKSTLTLKASCDNYEDFTITLNITLTEKDDQKALAITGDTSVIYGEKLTLTTTGGSGTGAVTYHIDTAISTGEATIDPNTGVLTPVKVGSVSVIATKAGDKDYNDVTSAPFVLMIKPATPTGKPKYTKITNGSKTLKDAALTIEGGTLSPNDGKLEWVDDEGNILPDDTKVKANKTYKWRFTPTDTNYTILSGEVKLYHKSGSSSSYSYYTIKATAGTGGSISPSGDVSVREGKDQTFTITPDKGYAVSRVKIDGKSIGAVKSYTFENVSRAHTIEVIFVKGTASASTGDSSNLPLWSITLITSLAGCLALAAWQRRRRREEDSPQITEK